MGNKQVATADPVYAQSSASSYGAQREISPTEDLSRLSLRTRRTAFDQYIDHPWKDEGKDTVGRV